MVNKTPTSKQTRLISNVAEPGDLTAIAFDVHFPTITTVHFLQQITRLDNCEQRNTLAIIRCHLAELFSSMLC